MQLLYHFRFFHSLHRNKAVPFMTKRKLFRTCWGNGKQRLGTTHAHNNRGFIVDYREVIFLCDPFWAEAGMSVVCFGVFWFVV